MVDALCANLGEPLFYGFGFFGGNRLDDTENAFNVGEVYLLLAT